MQTDNLQTAAPAEPRGVAANYQYWRDHGQQWAAEYDRRKLQEPLYHIQEYMLTEYLLRHAPAKVLEYGCGVGRHLRNLVQIPGLDVRGYDQSASMVSGCLTWTDQAWIDRHVTVGGPVARLPYGDGEFDIVYTAEVLVHVRPDDLDAVLGELVRVCRGHVLHLETSPDFPILSDDHDGCWKHDLVEAYRRLGRDCELLPGGYACHAPYRVVVGQPGPRFTWPPLLLDLMRLMESRLKEGFGDLDRQAAELEQARREQAELRTRNEQLEQRIRVLEEQRRQSEQFVRRLNAVLAAGAGV